MVKIFKKITKIDNLKVEKIVKKLNMKSNYKFSVVEDEEYKLKVERINGRMKLNIDDIKKLDKEFNGLIDKKTSYIKDDNLYLDFNYFGSGVDSEETETEEKENPEINFYK